MQIHAAWRTDEIRRAPPTPQDEMRAGMSYFQETIWNGLPTFLRRLDTALKAIGVKERFPYNLPLIQFSSWMGGDRDGEFSVRFSISNSHPLDDDSIKQNQLLTRFCFHN